jgi:cobalt-zinc-cadmium efflux system protein
MMTEIHDHSPHDHHHHGPRDRTALGPLWITFAINAVFLVVELVGGIIANSLALMADAGHMAADVAALLLAIVVAQLARRSPTPRLTYGLLRAEVLGALANGATLVLIVFFIFWEAFRRFSAPELQINGVLLLVVALLGLAANGVSAYILHGSHRENINVKAAYLHMLGDMLGSLGAVTAGVVIYFTGWTPIDPIASILIGCFILVGSWGLLTETIGILLESTPPNLDFHEIESAILSLEHIASVHDLHIWTIASGIPSLSAHIKLDTDCCDTAQWSVCLQNVQTMLREHYDIDHTTLQVEPENFEQCSICVLKQLHVE